MSNEVKISSGKGFKFITNFVIHETDRQKIVLDFKYIPGSDGTLHHITLEITKFSKKPTEHWEDIEPLKIILSTDKPQQSLTKLVNALKSQGELYTRTNSKVVILDPDEADLFKQLGEENIEFLEKIIKSFGTPEARKKLLELSQENLNELFASVKQAKNRKAVQQLKEYVNTVVKEQDFQVWIGDNTWVFGTEYIKKFDTRKIGIHSQADFIVQSLDGFTDLVELKKADVALFDKDESHNCYYPSRDLSQVIGQAIHYIKVMEDHRSILKEGGDLDILKPRVKIVIGRSVGLTFDEKKALRLLNASLHGVEVITYDEILSRAEKIIKIYDSE